MAQDESWTGKTAKGNWDELILAYAAGELSPDDEACVEAYLSSHPQLAETVALYWSLRLLYARDQLETPSARATWRVNSIFSQDMMRAPIGARLHALARQILLG